MEPEGLDEAIERSRFALGEIIKGNPEPWEAVFSHQDDVTFGNPFGPFAGGWKQDLAGETDIGQRVAQFDDLVEQGRRPDRVVVDDEAPQGYVDFDRGASARYILNPR